MQKTKQKQLAVLRSLLGEHGMSELCKAANLTTSLEKCWSYSHAQETLKEVRDLVSHYTPSKNIAVSGTAKNILSRAKKLVKEGNFGDGVWWVD